MLVLSRKKGESVEIDGGVVVTVLEIRGDKVRLGFEAPGATAVYRKEVADKIREAAAHKS